MRRYSRSGAAEPSCEPFHLSSKISCIAMSKGDELAVEDPRGVHDARMRTRVYQGVGELARESLGDDRICGVTTTDEQPSLGTKELCEFVFEFRVERVIASGAARGSDVEAEFFGAIVECAQDFWVTREAEVIAAAEVA